MSDMGHKLTQKRVRWPRARLGQSAAPLLEMPVWAVAVIKVRKLVNQRVARRMWGLWHVVRTSRATLPVRVAVFVENSGHEVSPLIERLQAMLPCRAKERRVLRRKKSCRFFALGRGRT